MVIAVLLLVLLFTAGLLATTYIHIPSEKFSSWLQSFYLKDSPRSPLVMNSSIETSSTSPIASYGEMGAYKRAELKGVFATFDKNGDGFITKQELRESLKNIGILMSKKEVEEMVAKVDSNGDGLIDFEEFCVLCETTWCSSSVSAGDQEIKESGDSSSGSGDDNKEMDLKEAFDVFDKDKDGLISVEELRSVLSSLGLKEGGRVEDCKEMIRKVDMDGDGMVNFDEFKKMMMRSGGGHKLVSAY